MECPLFNNEDEIAKNDSSSFFNYLFSIKHIDDYDDRSEWWFRIHFRNHDSAIPLTHSNYVITEFDVRIEIQLLMHRCTHEWQWIFFNINREESGLAMDTTSAPYSEAGNSNQGENECATIHVNIMRTTNTVSIHYSFVDSSIPYGQFCTLQC